MAGGRTRRSGAPAGADRTRPRPAGNGGGMAAELVAQPARQRTGAGAGAGAGGGPAIWSGARHQPQRSRPVSGAPLEPNRAATDRGAALAGFFLDDLRRRGQGEALSDDDLMPAQAQLKRIVGDKPITVLLAGSVPELMLCYVRRLGTPVDPALRRREGLEISEKLVQRGLRVVALASHRQAPGGQPLFQPLELLGAPPDWQERLTALHRMLVAEERRRRSPMRRR